MRLQRRGIQQSLGGPRTLQGTRIKLSPLMAHYKSCKNVQFSKSMDLICQCSYLIWTRISDFVDKGVIMTFLDFQDPALQIQRGRGGAQAGQVE